MKKLSIIYILISLFIIGNLNAQNCINCNDPSPYSDLQYRSKAGLNTIAKGSYSFAGGELSIAEGKRSFAFGNSVLSQGINSVAQGSSSSALGDDSFALGTAAVSSGTGSFAIGTRVHANYTGGFTIGIGAIKGVLENRKMETMVIGFNSVNPTLFISRSPNESEPYELTGKVGIGNVTNPLAKLHIKGDKGEEADLFIQPAEWTSKTNATIRLGNDAHIIRTDGALGMLFMTPIDRSFAFLYGKVGIGTTKPMADLDIEGDVRIAKYLNVEGDVKIATNLNVEGDVRIATNLNIEGGLRVLPFATQPGQHKIIFADENGMLFTDNIPLYDNLGNHIAEQDIITNGNWIKNSEEGDQLGIFISDANNVGIGTSKPMGALHVNSNNNTEIIAFSTNPSNAGFWAANSVFAFGFGVDKKGIGHISANINTPVNIMNFFSSGKVSIGNAEPIVGTSHRLFVEGGITSEEVVINTLTKDREWPDYVFKKDYTLMPLTDLKEYINTNGHLPNVPTAEDVSLEGQNLGEINTILLEKIEELTLYLIEQQEEIENLKKMIHE